MAKDAVRLVRLFVIRLGAMDPREMKYYKSGAVPLSKAELRLIERGQKHFAPLANLMARDFSRAFGIGPTEDVRLHTQSLDSVLIDSEAVARGDRDMFQLEGDLWYQLTLHDIRSKIFIASDPRDRLQKAAQAVSQLEAHIEMISGITYTAQLAPNGFCTPNSGLIVVQRQTHVSRNSWSDSVSRQRCWVGRLRPGDIFMEVLRCGGSNGGQNGDFSDYVDWRVRFNAILFKGNILDGKLNGAIGQFASSGDLLTLAASAGGFAGMAAASGAVKAFSPMVHSSKFLSSMLMMSASTLPLFGVAAVVGAQVTAASFTLILKNFLAHMETHGVAVASAAPSSPQFGVIPMLRIGGTVLHREKLVPVRQHDQVTLVPKVQKFITVHVHNWNNANIGVALPMLGAISINANLELDWDLTPWAERVLNRPKFLINQKRIGSCAACLQRGHAFCDWRLTYGSNWTESMDTCLPDDEKQRIRCESTTSLDDLGNRVGAQWYSISEGLAACQDIDFQRANRQFRLNDVMRRYFRRK